MLNHTYQLQERGHDTKGDGAVAQADAAPYEGQQIAQTEHTAHDNTHGHGETHTAHDVALEALLHRLEAVGNPLLGAQRAQHGIVLHTLLHLHLYAALVLADIERHLAQAARYQLAKHDGHGREQQQGPSQTGVEPAHEQERATQLNKGDGYLGDGVGTHAADGLDILDQARGDIARVQLLFGIKLTAEQAAEDAQAQGVCLVHASGGGEPVAHLTEQHTA